MPMVVVRERGKESHVRYWKARRRFFRHKLLLGLAENPQDPHQAGGSSSEPEEPQVLLLLMPSPVVLQSEEGFAELEGFVEREGGW